MDPQGSLTIYYSHDPRALEKDEATLYWGLMKDKTLDSLILAKPEVWPDLIPASISLAGAEPELTLLWDSATGQSRYGVTGVGVPKRRRNR